MKILLCAPYSGVVGGIAKWTDHLLQYAKTVQGVTIELLDFSRTRNGQLVRYSWLKGIYALIDYVKLIRKARRVIKKTDADILHICSSASFLLVKDLCLLHAARRRKIKTIIHFHFGRIPAVYASNNWERRLLDRVIQQADRIVVIDQASFKTLITRGINKVDLLPNPLASDIVSTINSNKDIARDRRKLLFAGHVIETKGVFELVEACRSIENIRLEMIGAVSDVMRSKLKMMAGTDNERWLNIAGEVDGVTAVKEMLSAGVFVLPSYTEGFPNVILESMACGCPIVATNVGAIPEMLDIKNGFNYGICVTPRDVPQLRAAILKMLNDTKYALQCGENARDRVFSLYTIANIWVYLIKIWESVK